MQIVHVTNVRKFGFGKGGGTCMKGNTKVTYSNIHGIIASFTCKVTYSNIHGIIVSFTCRGARNLVTPLLAGLMEVDQGKMWNFDKFFSEVHKISTKKCIHVMSMCTCKPLHVYVDKQQRLGL